MKGQFDEVQYQQKRIEEMLKNPVFRGAIRLMHQDLIFLDLMFQLYLLEAAGAHHHFSDHYIRVGQTATQRLRLYLDDLDDNAENYFAYHVIEIWEFFSRIERIDKSYYKRNGLRLLFDIAIYETRVPTYSEWRLISPVLANLFHSSIVPIAAFLMGMPNVELTLSEQSKATGLIMGFAWLWIAAENAYIIRNPKYHAEIELRRIVTKGRPPRSPLHFSLYSELATGVARGYVFYMLGALVAFLYDWWVLMAATLSVIWVSSDIVGYFLRRKPQQLS
jgi:hypothetical protein